MFLAWLIAKALPNGRPFWEMRRFPVRYPLYVGPGDTVVCTIDRHLETGWGRRELIATRELSRVVTAGGVLQSAAEAREFVEGK